MEWTSGMKITSSLLNDLEDRVDQSQQPFIIFNIKNGFYGTQIASAINQGKIIIIYDENLNKHILQSFKQGTQYFQIILDNLTKYYQKIGSSQWVKTGSLLINKGIWVPNEEDETENDFNFKINFTNNNFIEEQDEEYLFYEKSKYQIPEDIIEKLPEKTTKTQNQSSSVEVEHSTSLSGYPEENSEITTSGTFGTCIYEIWSDGTLLIYPENGVEGQLGNTSGKEIATGYSSDAPWYASKDTIVRVIVQEGVKTGTSCAALFAGLNYVTDMDLFYLDTSESTNMNYMFCMDQAGTTKRSKITSLDLSNFNTSKVTSMVYMFHYCYNLNELNISSFDTSLVTDMNHMFYYCYYLQVLDVSSFNTSNVTNMSYMFYYNYSMRALDLSNFNTSNVTNMYSMFYQDTQLKTINLSSFDTSKVTDMRFMFLNNLVLQDLDVSHFNTSNVLKMNNMFDNCRSLTHLDLKNFDTSKVTDMFKMFYQCCKLKYLDISSFDMANLTRKGNMLDTKLSGAAMLYTLCLGEKCILDGTGLREISEMNSIYSQTLYTGKWILENNSSNALTSTELMSLYDGINSIKGTWVWEEKTPIAYKINFENDNPNITGQKGPMRERSNADTTIINSFSCYESSFLGFTDGTNEFLSYNGQSVIIPANTYQGGSNIILSPLFASKKYKIKSHLYSSLANVSLKSNQTICLNGIYPQSSYNIEEQQKDSWDLIYESNPTGYIMNNINQEASFINGYSNDLNNLIQEDKIFQQNNYNNNNSAIDFDVMNSNVLNYLAQFNTQEVENGDSLSSSLFNEIENNLNKKSNKISILTVSAPETGVSISSEYTYNYIISYLKQGKYLIFKYIDDLNYTNFLYINSISDSRIYFCNNLDYCLHSNSSGILSWEVI